MSGGGGNQEVKNEPWSGVQPYLSELFRYGQRDVLERPLEFYPQSTVVPFAPETEYGLGATTNRAYGGSPLNPMAQMQVGRTLAGDYMAGGEGYDAYLDSLMSQVQPAVASQFGSAGRAGSPGMAEALGRGIGRGMAPLYDAERSRMMGASSLAPQLAREDYYDMDRMLGVGAQRENLYGRELADQIARWDFEQGEPFGRLSRYSTLLQGGIPFGTRETSGASKGAGQTAMGAAGLGLSAARMGGPGGFGMWGG